MKDNTSLYSSITLGQYLKEYSDPLRRYFGITNLGYLQIFPDHSYFYICNNEELIKQYTNTINRTELFYDYQLNNSLPSQDFVPIMWPQNPVFDTMELYLKYNYWHGLSFIKHNKDNVELWWVATSKDNPSINNFYIRNYAVLTNLITNLDIKLKKICPINQRKLFKFTQGVDFSNLKTPILQSLQQEQRNIVNFLDETKCSGSHIELNNGELITLSPRESICLNLLSTGKTMKEAAIVMNISPRTVESHLRNIKEKTGYRYKSELLQKHKKLFSL
jgi:DNA-binding CsgD family transcriptional regulator